MSPRKPMTPRTIRVSDKLWDDAQAAAAANDELISEVIRKALEQYVKHNLKGT